MPVYNGAAFIAEAIESVLAQTYPNWELIIIDDGSIDSTPQVIARYQDQRIIKLAQANAGEASARNAGLAHARGVYIAFLDADDLYLPEALADMLSFLAGNPQFDVVFSNGYVIDERDRRLSQLSDHRPGIFVGNILESLILNAAVITVPVCTLTRRALVDQSRASFDHELMIGEDWDFWIQLAQHGRFGYLDRLTCAYRVHQTNMTRRSGWQRRRADLIRIRLKVLRSNWFGNLSLATRLRFVQLLIDLMPGDSDQQRSILNDEPVTNLPFAAQAEVWRQTGRSHLLRGLDTEFAAECFRTALQKSSADRKSRILLFVLSRLGRWPTIGLIKIQERWVNFNGALWRHGKVKPQPVPAGLGSFKNQSV